MVALLFLCLASSLQPIRARKSPPGTQPPWVTAILRSDPFNPSMNKDGLCSNVLVDSHNCQMVYLCEGNYVDFPYCQSVIYDSACQVIGQRTSPMVGDTISGNGILNVVVITSIHEAVDIREIDKGIHVGFEYAGVEYGAALQDDDDNDGNNRKMVFRKDCRYGSGSIGWTRCVFVRTEFEC